MSANNRAARRSKALPTLVVYSATSAKYTVNTAAPKPRTCVPIARANVAAALASREKKI